MEEDSGGHAAERCLTGNAKDETGRSDDRRSIRNNPRVRHSTTSCVAFRGPFRWYPLRLHLYCTNAVVEGITICNR